MLEKIGYLIRKCDHKSSQQKDKDKLFSGEFFIYQVNQNGIQRNPIELGRVKHPKTIPSLGTQVVEIEKKIGIVLQYFFQHSSLRIVLLLGRKKPKLVQSN